MQKYFVTALPLTPLINQKAQQQPCQLPLLRTSARLLHLPYSLDSNPQASTLPIHLLISHHVTIHPSLSFLPSPSQRKRPLLHIAPNVPSKSFPLVSEFSTPHPTNASKQPSPRKVSFFFSCGVRAELTASGLVCFFLRSKRLRGWDWRGVRLCHLSLIYL